MMKKNQNINYICSCFNFVYTRHINENIIYNTFSKALVLLSDEEYQQYETLNFYDEEFRHQLIDNGILVEETFDEREFLKYFHYKTKFSNDTLFLTIAPTLDCNFGCPYCYENRRPGKMSMEIQNALIVFIKTLIIEGVNRINISWYGGEPLLYLDILESLGRKIKALAQDYNCILDMHLVTNGYLLTSQIVELLDELSITRIQITLDGLKEHHDERRPLRNGEGTFDRIFENLSLFQDFPIEILVRMNVDNINWKDFEALKVMVDSLKNPYITVYASPVENINNDTVNEISDFMTKDEFDAFTIQACENHSLSADDFSVMDNRYCFCTAETENCYVVDDRGDFYKCWDEVGRQEYVCFNILDKDNINYSAIAKYLTGDPFSNASCKDCVFLPLCFGGCKFQKSYLNKSVCGFTEETLKKYIEMAFLKGGE